MALFRVDLPEKTVVLLHLLTFYRLLLLANRPMLLEWSW